MAADAAESRRRQAVQSWQGQYKKRKALVSQSLAYIDHVRNGESSASSHKPTAKHVKFESDSSEENEEKPTSSKQRLFNNSDSDDDERDAEQSFDIKPHYFGPKGAKLMRLESKYGGDKRFTLDERFVENAKETMVHSTDQTEADEKKRQFDALERVLGHAVPKEQLLEKKEGRKRKKNSEQVPLGTRYDPSNPQHQHLMRNVPEAGEEPQKRKKEREKKGEQQKEEKVKQTTHSKVLLDEDFVQQLREEKEEKQSTSLLTLLSEIPRTEMEDDDEEEEQEEQVRDEEMEPIQEPQLKKWQRDILTQTTSRNNFDKPKTTGKEKQMATAEGRQSQPELRAFFPSAKALENAMRAFKRTQPKERLEASHTKTKKRMQQRFQKARKEARHRNNKQQRQMMAYGTKGKKQQ